MRVSWTTNPSPVLSKRTGFYFESEEVRDDAQALYAGSFRRRRRLRRYPPDNATKLSCLLLVQYCSKGGSAGGISSGYAFIMTMHACHRAVGLGKRGPAAWPVDGKDDRNLRAAGCAGRCWNLNSPDIWTMSAFHFAAHRLHASFDPPSRSRHH